MEGELDGKSFAQHLGQIWSHSRGVLWDEYIRHDTSSSVHRTSEGGRITQVFIELDTIFWEVLSMFISCQPIHFVVAVFTILIRALNAASGWSIIAGNGQPDGWSVTEVDRLLYQAFTERTATHYHTSVVILNSTGENFTGRSRTFVNQHDNGHFLATACSIGKFVGTGIFASFRIDYQFTFGQEFVDHAHCSFHISSCVAT